MESAIQATHVGYKPEHQLMNEPIEISSLTDYINEINTIFDSEKNYLYRGQENEEWQVNSSAYRRLEISTSPSEQASDREYNHSSELLRSQHRDYLVQSEREYNRSSELLRSQHRDYIVQIVDEIQLKYPSTYRDLHPLECMAHLQHNKVATGLIDFTFNPLVALWFACDKENDEDTNGKVIVLENDSGRIEEIKTIEELERNLGVFFGENQERWYLWAPTLDSRKVDTERMIMQQSVFLFGLPEMDRDMIAEEIIIPAEHKEKVRTELAKIGIAEETLFADLLGFFERNTARHFYDPTLVTSNDGGKLP